VNVLYFAHARDAAGKRSELIELPRHATVEDILTRVVRSHPAMLPLKSSIRLSVNRELVGAKAEVKDGDEVGVLPPVAGG